MAEDFMFVTLKSFGMSRFPPLQPKLSLTSENLSLRWKMKRTPLYVPHGAVREPFFFTKFVFVALTRSFHSERDGDIDGKQAGRGRLGRGSSMEEPGISGAAEAAAHTGSDKAATLE